MDPHVLKSNEDIEKEIASLKDEIANIKAEASQLRKNGTKTDMVEVKLLNVVPKIKMAQATHSLYDIKKVEDLIYDIKNEMEECKRENHFEKSLMLIDKITRILPDENIEEASELYIDLQDRYKELPDDMRNLVYPASMHLFKKISEIMNVK